MRLVFGIGAAVLLAGCADTNPDALWGREPAPQQASQQVAAVNVTCDRVAKIRASDATYSGYDQAMQAEIYRGTYKSCLQAPEHR